MKLILSILYISLLTTVARAQDLDKESPDPYGFVTKFNPKFNGIGPKVYILPTPRTLAEEMIDTYNEISSYEPIIQQGIFYDNFIENFQTFHKIDSVELNSLSEALVESNIQHKKYENAYNMLNLLAKKNIGENKYDIAKEHLEKAIKYAEIALQHNDVAILQTNLANLEFYLQNFHKSERLFKLGLTHYTENNNVKEKPHIITQLALVQAKQKDYKTAENAIIRQAIPMYNKSKNYEGKINSWLVLADIYRLQNKHTEAQWFLLQARDLAKDKNLEKYLAKIEYMLGSSKSIQQNYRVAKEEMLQAYYLVQNEPNNHLKLAIVENLGRIFTHLGEYQFANNYLNEYWELRKDIKH